MALTAAQVQAYYIGFYGRPADPVGLNYWITQDAAAAEAGFGASAEYTNLYAGMTTEQRVSQIYVNVLGRAADVTGLVYWSGELVAGRATTATIITQMMTNALGKDVTTIADRKTYAQTFTDALDTTAEIVSYTGTAAATAARTVMATIVATAVDDHASLTAATAVVNTSVTTVTSAGSSTSGSTFTLTTGVDTFVGGAGADSFVADMTVNGVMSAADTLTGGNGTDTLKIYDDATNAITIPSTMSGVENIYAHMGDIGESMNIASRSEVTGLTVEAANVGAAGANAALDYTLAAGQALTLTSVLDTGNSTNDVNVNAAATVTSVSVTLNGVGSTTTAADDLELDIAGTGVTTVSLATTGSASNISLIQTGAALTTLNVSGDKALTIRNAIDVAGTTSTINASGMSGNLTFSAATGNESVTFTGGSGKNSITTGSGNDTLTGGAAADTLNSGTGNDTITGGDGNDTITVGAGVVNVSAGAGDDTVTVAGHSSDDVLAGGDGTDTLSLVIADADAADAAGTAGTALRATYSGFERLTLDTIGNNQIAVNTLGFNYVTVTGDVSNAAAALTGLATDATLKFAVAADHTAALIATMTGAATSTTDVLNIVAAANIADNANHAYKVAANGINTVNVNASDADNSDEATSSNDGYTVTLTSTANLNYLNFTGSSKVTYVLNADAVAIRTIDASASTGDTNIDLSAFAGLERVTIKGSSGNNTIVGDNASFGEAIIGGSKADTITAGVGADALTGNGGRDAYVLGGDTDSTSASMDTIADFGKATIAATAGEVTAMNSTAAFQATATAKGGAEADVLKFSTTATLGGAQTATDVATAEAGGGAGLTITATESAKGLLVLAGANASSIDTASEWIAVANIMAATTNNVVEFEFGGNTYLFQQDTVNGDSIVLLTGVTGATGICLIGGATAAAVGDLFVL